MVIAELTLIGRRLLDLVPGLGKSASWRDSEAGHSDFFHPPAAKLRTPDTRRADGRFTGSSALPRQVNFCT